MNLDSGIEQIVTILQDVFPNLIFDENQQQIKLENQTLNQRDIENDLIKQSIFDNVCKNLAFLYVQPLIETQQSIAKGQEKIPFGVTVTEKDKDETKICEKDEEVNQIQEYFYNKLRILVYLNELKNNQNQYQIDLKNAKGDKKNAEDKFNEWNQNINEIIKQVQNNNISIDILNDLINRFTSMDKTTLELCNAIAKLCPDEVTPVCSNDTNILSVQKSICKKKESIISSVISSLRSRLKPKTKQQEKNPINIETYITNEELIQIANQALLEQKPINYTPINYIPEICVFQSNVEVFEDLKTKYPNNTRLKDLIETITIIQSIPLQVPKEIKISPEQSKILKPIDENQQPQQQNLVVDDINIWIETETTGMNEKIGLYPITLSDYCENSRKPVNKNIDCQSSIIKRCQIITTIGDGTCLLHAFLISISPNYREATTVTKSNIGFTFRKDIIGEILPNVQQIRDDKYRKYLDTDILKNLADIYNLNIFLFSVQPVDGSDLFVLELYKPSSNESKKYICMFYKSVHFSAVRMFDQFILESPKDDKIIEQYKKIVSVTYKGENIEEDLS